MKARLHSMDQFEVRQGVHAELVVWVLPTPARGSRHDYKYRLALIADGECVLRYDNEAGKGDHRHLGNREYAYDFVDLDQLAIDFWEDVHKWLEASER